ncbi:hypothetical protein [Marinobacter zhejiangensis]|uniref:Uncharacterized protein n=1 Tax=Marinobacter zhejiangensis TaxID=488535 RepID=A0A1I4PYT3_9GAMM|nr:hypothetical protein [Marinobacter zhejiangensis]SFM32972.1 hypothetical protein SAMN04487963_2083 [Marinobacter zhejiangensis]
MLKKAAIIICVVIIGFAGLRQISQSMDQATRYDQQMDAQRQDILSKRQELVDQLQTVEAKPNPSDHDRWLMAHLTKSIEGLDKVIGTVDAGQQRMARQSFRTWAGLGGVFLGLATFALVFAYRPDSQLSAEDRALLQHPLSQTDGIRLDPQSYQSEAAPVSSGANFVTGRIRQQDIATLRIQGGRMMKAFAAAFIMGPVTYLGIDGYYLLTDVLNRGMEAEFSSVLDSLVMMASFGLGAILILNAGGPAITVDRQAQVFRVAGKQSDIPFGDVASLQFNDILVTGKYTHQNHQIQLNLKNGQSLSLLNHAGKEQMQADLIRLARFTGLPIAVPAV